MSESVPNLASSLLETANAVAALGASVDDLSILDDASVVAGMALVRDHRRALQAYELALAAVIARRSDHTLGYDGLARRNGSATPAIFIQSMTGSSIEEATKLARLGQSMVDAAIDGVQPPPAAVAAVSGGISLDVADAIRRGLGKPDSAVSEAQLRDAAQRLIDQASSPALLETVTPEMMLKLARQEREQLDLAAIERGEKERSEQRYVRTWERDGFYGGSWRLTGEDGGLEIHNTLKLLVANKTGGPRFADPDDAKSRETDVDAAQDTRTPEQAMADGFSQIFHNGLTADPSIVPGAGRAAVRVIVTEKVLQQRAGSAILEDNLSAISFGKLEEYLCEGGTVGILFNDDGTIDVGREQRLYTARQRKAMAVRDGGCRFPGCNKPPSWTEAHHIAYWARDKGRTDIANGILLCRYHHMLMHNSAWQIIRSGRPDDAGGGYWIKPPIERDPEQRLIPMPSKNPIVLAMTLAEAR